VARRRRPEPVTYDGLYWYFARELYNGESSIIEWGREDLEGHWTTVVETKCGMYLHRPPLYRECGYGRAPLNSVKFAHTGGDGCHYSFLVLDGHWSELSPVVVTAPTNFPSPYNFVLAGDLREFLCLGIRTGYFGLPSDVPCGGRADVRRERIRPLEANEFAEWVEPEMEAALKQLAARFGLAPLKGVAKRWAELQRRYGQLLQLPPERNPFNFEAERAALDKQLRDRFLPGDAVIWDREVRGRGVTPLQATAVAVRDHRVTIAVEDPDETGAGLLTRHVSPVSLRLQRRSSSSPSSHPWGRF
jgi:hypothetical protein